MGLGKQKSARGRMLTRTGGKEGKGGGKGGEEDSRQKKLTDEWGKKVTFEKTKWDEVDEEIKSLKASVLEEVKKLRADKVEILKAKVEMESEIAYLRETVVRLENRVEILEKREKEREEERSVKKCGSCAGEISETGTREGDTESAVSMVSGLSKWSKVSGMNISER